MRITHLGHACVLAELDSGARILIDPGSYSTGFTDLTGLDAVLVTHEHPDHLDLERLPEVLRRNRGVLVVADSASGERLAAAGIDHNVLVSGDDDAVTVRGSLVRALTTEHAVIHPDVPRVPNNGYLIDGILHPGDALVTPPDHVRVLLVPAGGPWMKAGEGVDFLRAVSPEIAVPIHQAGLATIHQRLHYKLFRDLGPSGMELTVLDEGVPTVL